MVSDATTTCAVCGVEQGRDELLKRPTMRGGPASEAVQELAITCGHESDYEYECEEHTMRRQVRDAHRNRGSFSDRCK